MLALGRLFMCPDYALSINVPNWLNRKTKMARFRVAPELDAWEVLLLRWVPLGRQQQRVALTGVRHEPCGS